MKTGKRLQAIFIALLVIAFSPILIVGSIVAGIAICCGMGKARRQWKVSEYRKRFGGTFSMGLVNLPEYRFYNAAVKHGIPMRYIRQASNRFEYIVFQNQLFLFPDFDQMDYDSEKQTWEANFDGEWRDFDQAFFGLLEKLDSPPELPVKLLIERAMLLIPDPGKVGLPDCIALIWSYETAFEKEENPLRMIIPQDAEQLYEMMRQTPELCGNFELEKNAVLWRLYQNMVIRLYVDPRDCCVDVMRKIGHRKAEYSVTHWHPESHEMYDTVCRIGKRGNVMVIRSCLAVTGVLYIGKKEDCPYSPYKRYWFKKMMYLEAK